MITFQVVKNLEDHSFIKAAIRQLADGSLQVGKLFFD